MTTLWSDINTGNTRDCQPAIEEVGESLVEIEESDVPADYVVRLRAEQAGLRKSLLRVYHIQREQFLHSATAMITTTVAVMLALLLVTDKGGLAESLVTPRLPLLLPLPAAATERHRHPVQGRGGARRR